MTGYSISRNGKVLWQSHPGPQSDLFDLAWESGASELLYGGARGGGKTAAMTACLVRYVDNPNYKGLAVRETAGAQLEWIDSAWNSLYKHMGAKKEGKPVSFRFPSGAIIYTGHLSGEKSVEDYKGNEYWIICVDEATQIKEFRTYEKLQGSNRSPDPKYPAKMFLFTNPDGPGNTFLKKRFIHVSDADGKRLPPKTVFRIGDGKFRVFVPARVYDNPVYMNPDNPEYLIYLQNLEGEATKKAWLEGDWDASEGSFYPEFRPHGPYASDREPDHANHVIPAHELPGWYHRWAACDWGHNHYSVIYWAAYDNNGRIQVYDEMAVRQIGAEELGSEFAKRSKPAIDAMPDRALTLYLAPDTFGSRNVGRTIAEQIQTGIERILGPGSCFMLAKTEAERLAAASKDAAYMAQERFLEEGGRAKVIVKKANNGRIAGASMLRTLLRWRRIYNRIEPDLAYARSLLANSDGRASYDAYMAMFKNQQSEIPVPGIWFHDTCKQIIECIPKLRPDVHQLEDVQKFDGDGGDIGDDPYDALRYLVMGAEEQKNRAPYHEFLAGEIERLVGKDADINLKMQIAMRTKEKYQKTETDLVVPSLTRASMEQRWRN